MTGFVGTAEADGRRRSGPSATAADPAENSGPLRADCEVVSRDQEGAYLGLTVAAPEIARRTRPGQFVNVGVEAQHAMLRRPFSVYRASRQGPGAGTVAFVLDAHGPGTRWLARRVTGDVLDVVGPLGTCFRPPGGTGGQPGGGSAAAAGGRGWSGGCLLIGGGYGAAPMLFLADRLRGRGHRVDLIVGASTKQRLFNTMRAKRIANSVTFTTDDGTEGTEGVVTDVFDEVAERTGAKTVYACGPMPMLRAVTTAAAARGLDSQVAVEEHMACGIGVCWTCVVPIETGAGHGRVDMRRSCLDGPVFDGGSIAWWHSRWAPEAGAAETARRRGGSDVAHAAPGASP